ncbi:helicase C-terminal domain-containing protein [Escherichia coli]
MRDAYQLPGMNNVLQAAGRLIRSAKDTGIVLLLDLVDEEI